MTTTENAPMGRKKSETETGRLEIRAPLEWLARLDASAARFGLSASAYVRMAVTERMEADDRTAQSQGKRK